MIWRDEKAEKAAEVPSGENIIMLYVGSVNLSHSRLLQRREKIHQCKSGGRSILAHLCTRASRESHGVAAAAVPAVDETERLREGTAGQTGDSHWVDRCSLCIYTTPIKEENQHGWP